MFWNLVTYGRVKYITPGRIPIEQVKNAPRNVFDIFAQMFTKCLKDEDVPNE